MALSSNARKLQLWFERYKITARQYYDRITSNPRISSRGAFLPALIELLGGTFYFLAIDETEEVDFNGVYILDATTGELNTEKIIQLPTEVNVESNNIAILDGYLYNFSYDDDPGLNYFQKINLETLEVTEISLSGDTPVEGEIVIFDKRFISDGGGDMYDTGNILNTNLTNNWESIKEDQIINDDFTVVGNSIPYTHTQQADSFLEFIGDGIITSSDSIFGLGSSYVTNLYPGFFSLNATNINITEFNVTGDVGADGSGIVSVRDFVIGDYSIYTKMVSGAGDPSILHMIIIPTQVGVMHETPNITYYDDDRIYGLNNTTTELHYFVLSKDGGLSFSETEQDNIATLLISKCGGKTLIEITEDLFVNYTDITNLYSDKFNFSDFGKTEETVGEVEPLYNIDSMTIIPETNTFLLSDSDLAYTVTTNGVLTRLGSIAEDDVTGLIYKDSILYGIKDNSILVTVDLEELSNEEIGS